MKTILASLSLLILPVISHAQFEKGQKIISLGFSGAIVNNELEGETMKLVSTSRTFRLSTNIGIFVNPTIAIGLTMNYGDASVGDRSIFDQSNNFSQTRRQHYGAGIFARKYHAVSKRANLFLENTIGFLEEHQSSQRSMDNAALPPQKSSVISASYQLLPGIMVMLSDWIALEATIGYLSTSVRFWDAENDEDKRTYTDLRFSFQPIRFGLAAYF